MRNILNTQLSKCSLKRLILDSYQKSSGASLGSDLANIIMTQCKKSIVDDIINTQDMLIIVYYL